MNDDRGEMIRKNERATSYVRKCFSMQQKSLVDGRPLSVASVLGEDAIRLRSSNSGSVPLSSSRRDGSVSLRRDGAVKLKSKAVRQMEKYGIALIRRP